MNEYFLPTRRIYDMEFHLRAYRDRWLLSDEEEVQDEPWCFEIAGYT